jgi:hypothetical protein
MRIFRVSVLAVCTVAAAAACAPKRPPAVAPAGPLIEASFAPIELAVAWNTERVSWERPSLVRHADVEARLKAVGSAAPVLFQVEEIGRSVEGRSINHLWFGRGPLHVLLWSQMHGDEPTATAALFDVAEQFRRHRSEPAHARILDALTIHIVPMLNPDGAERFQRRNAQGIDINRDALRLQTPEGRALKGLRDRLNPAVGFNLHNQGWRTSAGKTGQPAAISLLSVAGDEARTETPGRLLTKQACALIREALEPLAPGRIARYDDEFEVRAFGDNLTKWGTSVILIETGPWPAAEPDPYLIRLNFVAMMTALDGLATGRARQADTRAYETLPINETDLFYLLVRNATVIAGTGVAPFTADIGVAANRGVRAVDGRREPRLSARIEDLGDLHNMSALESIDATGMFVAPLWDPALKAGDLVALPDFTARRAPRVIAVGEPVEFVILRRDGDRYVVERVVRY